MIVFRTEIGHPMGGSLTKDMYLLATLITFQMQVAHSLYGQSILTEIYLVKPNQMSCPILLSKFESQQSLARKELVTSSLQEESHRLKNLGLGVLTLALISTIITAISALPNKVMQMARSL
jgi:hypothetical protein